MGRTLRRGSFALYFRTGGLILSWLVMGAFSPVAASLLITPIYDSSITSDPKASAIEAAVNEGIAAFEGLFTDNVTASILFRYSSSQPNGNPFGTFVSRSNYVLYSIPSSTYTGALIGDAKTPNDNTAIANLPVSPLASRIDVSSADGRAVGLRTLGAMDANGNVGSGGTFDGIVSLNSTRPLQFSRTGGIVAGNYDAVRFIEHEIDEVLGLGSILPSTTDFSGNTAVRPEDLFRYSAPGVRSLIASGTATSYFSINGGTSDIAGFNQQSSGDYGDWLSPSCVPLPPPLVQYAFSCPGQTADLSATSPEAIALDVIGYDLAPSPVPEPTSLIIVTTGLGLMLLAKKVRAWDDPGGSVQPLTQYLHHCSKHRK